MATSYLKLTALTAFIALGSFASVSAHAAILRTSAGIPVLTKDGACVVTNWEGTDDCEAAKMVAGLDGSVPCQPAGDDEWNHHEKVVYFDFNKSSLSTRAQHHLDHLVQKIRHMARHKKHLPTLSIVGYADRLGQAEYNEKLALKRAESVRDYLVAKGVNAQKVEVRSLGKTVPKADCSADLPRIKMIECLREDRRVEIEFGADVK
jgi:outer membrane protein OmpA-like peptidoglycan-associated protein